MSDVHLQGARPCLPSCVKKGCPMTVCEIKQNSAGYLNQVNATGEVIRATAFGFTAANIKEKFRLR